MTTPTVLAAGALVATLLFLGHQWRLRGRPFTVSVRPVIADLWFGLAGAALFAGAAAFAWYAATGRGDARLWAISAAESALMGAAVLLLWRRVRRARRG